MYQWFQCNDFSVVFLVWFRTCFPNVTDCHDVTEILLTVVLNNHNSDPSSKLTDIIC